MVVYHERNDLSWPFLWSKPQIVQKTRRCVNKTPCMLVCLSHVTGSCVDVLAELSGAVKLWL